MAELVVKICQVCEEENKVDALKCVHCGTVLAPETTIIVPTKKIDQSRDSHVSELMDVHSDALILYVTTADQPIVVKSNTRVILGRRVPHEPSATIDLTQYNAYTLGISRQHAAIRSSEGGYVIEDLNSTNGTWLNDQRMVPHRPVPLRNGDTIKLGQLIVFAYFRALADRPIEQVLRLTQASPEKLTLEYLSNTVIPFLKAINEIQRIVDGLVKHPAFESHIKLITPGQNNNLEATIVGYAEAVNFLKVKFAPPKKEPEVPMSIPTVVLALPETTSSPENAPTSPAPTPTSNGQTTTETAPPVPEAEASLDTTLKLYASDLLVQVAPDLSEIERQGHITRLMPHLEAMSRSSLKLSPDSR